MNILRKWVQIFLGLLANAYWAFPFTRSLYQGPMKVICSPGLNCYSCPAATTYCPIGSIQALLASARLSLESGQLFLGFSVIGVMGVMGGFLGRMICGWACPFGLIQELLHKLPSRKFGIPRILRYGKYFFLVVFVVLLPLLVVDEFGGGTTWFCKYVCPAGTLEAGLPMLALQPELRSQLGAIFLNKFVIMVSFVIWSVLSSRPFCRVACPLGAFYALFRKVKMVRLRLDVDRCTNCHACHAVCPMGVRFNESPDDGECISCMACLRDCRFNAIYLDVAGIPLGAGSLPKGLPEERAV